ncbi:MAG: acyl-CoA thioesterase [Spirochaetota bacterium]
MAGGIPGPLFVELPFTVKTYDIDFAGHVSNIVYIRWLEDLRFALLDEYYPLDEAMSEGFAPVLSRTEIDYRIPIRLFEPVIGQMWAGKAGGVRMELLARFTVGPKLCAEVRQEGVFVSLESGRPVRAPAKLVMAYKAQQMML